MRGPVRLRVVVRYRAARSRFARFVTGSLAAHGVLLVAIVIVPLTHRRPTPVEDATVVSLVGSLPSPAAAGPKAVAPPAPAAPPKSEPAPAPAPKEAHTVREVPKPSAKPAKPLVKVETPSPTPPTPPATTPQEPTPGAPAPSGTKGDGGTGATGVTAVLGGGDAALGYYQAAVKAALEAAWIKPYLEEQGETFSVTLTFDIARDGTVRNARIEGPSGVPSLDRSALRAVIEASPLPPIPPNWTGDSLPATMRFDLTPDAR